MRFIQVMEFEATGEQASEEVNNYVAAAGSETTVRRITVCGDRDKRGTIVQLPWSTTSSRSLKKRQPITTQGLET